MCLARLPPLGAIKFQKTGYKNTNNQKIINKLQLILILSFITKIQEKEDIKYKFKLIYTLSNSYKDKEEEFVQLLFIKLQINIKKLFAKILLKNIYQKKKFKQELINISKLV